MLEVINFKSLDWKVKCLYDQENLLYVWFWCLIIEVKDTVNSNRCNDGMHGNVKEQCKKDLQLYSILGCISNLFFFYVNLIKVFGIPLKCFINPRLILLLPKYLCLFPCHVPTVSSRVKLDDSCLTRYPER